MQLEEFGDLQDESYETPAEEEIKQTEGSDRGHEDEPDENKKRRRGKQKTERKKQKEKRAVDSEYNLYL